MKCGCIRTWLTISLLIHLSVCVRVTTGQSGVEFFVSPDGARENAGLATSPISFDEAIDRARVLLQEHGAPEGGLTIWVGGGTYRLDGAIVLGNAFRGTADRPIVIRALPDESPTFDGGVPIDASGFARVTDTEERARLASAAADHIRVTTITDPTLISTLRSKVILTLTLNGQSYLPAVFPNAGYARLRNEMVEPEICPPGIPVGQQAYGVRAGVAPHREDGKAAGWKGSLTDPRGAWARIGEQAENMAGTWMQWQAELGRDNTRHILTGFLDADWLLSSQPIVAADAQREAVHLSRVLSYGWAWRSHKPFKVFGLLCELDQPGEWHFDALTNRLYVYPPERAGDSLSVAIPAASGFMTLDHTAHVSVIGLDVVNLAGGEAFRITGGHHNLVASAVVRGCVATGVSIDGHDNRVVGCDFIDLHRHASLQGGRRDATEIIAGRNEIANCHFYQRGFKHQKISIGVSGVGNIFRNNLVHNSLGQAMVVRGNDHLIELNELFNIGFDEGDGGAIYAGADLTGYGVVYRHNFFHHLMHVPGKVTRAGIHLDDLQAGATCEGNIFFKSAEKGIFMNGGAGHRVVGNMFLEGKYGALNRGPRGLANFERQERISRDENGPHRYSKEDYVGRAERVVGPNGWTRAPWSERYPVFNLVMSDAGVEGRLWPIHCHVEGNMYYGNSGRDATVWERASDAVRRKSTLRPDRVVSPSMFVHYDTMDFRFVEADATGGIPFERIGLTLDQYRDSKPSPAHYRTVIRAFFDGVGSMPGTHQKIDTGRVVEEGPVIHRATELPGTTRDGSG